MSSLLRPVYSSIQISERIATIGAIISERYQSKELVFIGVLKGGFIFLADLIRTVSTDCEIDFIQVGSYVGNKSSGRIDLISDVRTDLRKKDVIIVEDIIDSGATINFIYEKIINLSPSSLEVATLLYKKDIAKLEFNIEFIGFEISDEFVVGYGLDYNQKMRNLNAIYNLKYSAQH